MFDITNHETRERKLKYIEILLLIGGIIGGIRLQNNNDLMNTIFSVFLISSLGYYFMLSDTKINSKKLSPSASFSLQLGSTLISFGFSAIVVFPFILNEFSLMREVGIMVVRLVLFLLVYINLIK